MPSRSNNRTSIRWLRVKGAICTARQGQSLVEVLVAISLGAIFIIGAATIIAPSLQISKQTSLAQTKAELTAELLNNANPWAVSNWNGVLALATSSANIYHLNTSSSPFVAVMGAETIFLGTVSSTRYFYLDDVYRDSNGNVTSTVSGNSYDPSTKRITVVSNGTQNGAPTSTLVAYLTRNISNVFDQTDWSGGSGYTGPTKVVTNTFTSESGMDSSASGSLTAIPPSSGYGYYRTITVTSTGSVASGTNTNFPMLVSSTLATWEASSTAGGAGHIQNLVTAPNGEQEPADLVFATSSANCGTANLNFETEGYNSSTGALVDWVNVPSITGGTAIYLCYGNGATTSSQQNAAGTWGSNYVGVWHLPNGITLTTQDSTSLANNGTNNGTRAAAGQIGGGANSNGGGSQYISMGANVSSLHPASTLTISTWVEPTSGSQVNYAGIISQDYSNPRGNPFISYKLGIANINAGCGSATYEFEVATNTTTGFCVNSGVSYSNGTWAYVVGTYDGSNAKIYVNGILKQTVAATGNIVYSSSGDFRIFGNSTGGEQANATVDEARISNTARSAGWILTEYNNQSSPSNFYTIGSQQTVSGGGSSGSTATLNSAVFDTGDAAGAQFNSIGWHGNYYSGSTVQFQFAVSNSSSGPWTFMGPDGTGNTYYTPSGPGSPASLNYSAFNGYRYYRYLIAITYANGTSSQVNGVVVNWSP